MKICVGLSGGVDSTLTALLLQEQGHEVMGISMSLYNKDIPNLKLSQNSCYGPTEKADIRLIHHWCQKHGFQHHIVDLSKEFQQTILKYFRESYLSGQTPNPCIMCNAGIKFGLMLDKAKELFSFDAFATGHYARIIHDDKGDILAKGIDAKKDQSYFLYRLTQDQLARTLFPLGEYTKVQVRQMARERGLIQADQADSQDFYSGDYVDLLQVKPKLGDIILTDGKILGHHLGFWNYTIGQRKGLGIAYPEPLYVVGLDAQNNRVIVGVEKETFQSSVRISNIVRGVLWPHQKSFQCFGKFRSMGIPVPVQVNVRADCCLIQFNTPQKSLTPGQSIVFYQDDLVLGGGIIV